MSFWNVVWFIFISFAFVAYLMLLFSILSDIIRDHGTSGWVKAIWVVFLIVAPFLTALVYLIVQGPGMTQRSTEHFERSRAQQEDYIKQVAGTGALSPSEQIERAKTLLDSGALSAEEFDALKARALS